MNMILSENVEYLHWLREIKHRVHSSQIKAALQVNVALLHMYWDLGREMLLKQLRSSWGDLLITQLSRDLMAAFPEQKGFSRTNLQYIRKWVAFYLNMPIAPQVVGQLEAVDLERIIAEAAFAPQLVGQIPWGHHREIITKCTSVPEALFYLRATRENNWSRSVLLAQLESRLHERSGNAITNFEATLPLPQADLAREVLKSPYNFDFLSMGRDILERDLENALVGQIQKLLLELGQGFAYMGRQFPLRVGDSEFFLDLLFYHIKLRAFIILELKSGAFQPEFAGKLNFYLNAVDAVLKHPSDQPSIGILLCRTPDKVVVEYSLKNINNPLGVAEYQLTSSVPANLKESLPSIEQLALRLMDKPH